ncbi:hypothetical protein [Streptomyces sp. SID4985]|uniref:hypothetical protein n=1 Tax=unclassified Streptomyces TaxID=2593676 RepID=UPI001367AA8B|nr:hypothetical protein [Streptomyces sp. SID4985]MYQ43810.1 hypothetical protein [Streptomyces sp. SID4985]
MDHRAGAEPVRGSGPESAADARLIPSVQELLLAALMPFAVLPTSPTGTSYQPEAGARADKEL